MITKRLTFVNDNANAGNYRVLKMLRRPVSQLVSAGFALSLAAGGVAGCGLLSGPPVARPSPTTPITSSAMQASASPQASAIPKVSPSATSSATISSLPSCPGYISSEVNIIVPEMLSYAGNPALWKLSMTDSGSSVTINSGTRDLTPQIANMKIPANFNLSFSGSGTGIRGGFWAGQIIVSYNSETTVSYESSIARCSVLVGTLTMPPSSLAPSGATIPVNVNLTSGFRSVALQINPIPHAYDQTIEGNLSVSCSVLNSRILPQGLISAIKQSANGIYGCPQIPTAIVLPGVPIGIITNDSAVSVPIGESEIFTITPTINKNFSASSLSIGAGYKSTGIMLSYPGEFGVSVNGGIAGGSITMSLKGIQFNVTGPSAAAQVVLVSNTGIPKSYNLECAILSMGVGTNSNTSGHLYQCSTDTSVAITSGTPDTTTITGQGTYGSATNPIKTQDWLTSIGINWYGQGYYTMPNEKTLYFNTGQDLVTEAVYNEFTDLGNINSPSSQGSTDQNPIQPNSDGTLTWHGTGYYSITNKKANGGNPTGVYYISDQEYVVAYNSYIQRHG